MRHGKLLAFTLAAVAFFVPRALADEDKVDPAYEKRILKKADKIEKDVERIRGLKFQAPVRKGVQSEAALKKEILAEFAKPENQTEIENEAKLVRLFGFAKPDFNWKDESATLLAEQIAGFYDNDSKRLRLVQKKPMAGMTKEMAETNDDTVMAHELHHALQDQTFDLGRWFSLLEGHRDRITAWKSVVEGEATFMMIKWMLDKQAPGMEVPDLKSFMEMNKGMAESMPGAKEQAEKLAKLPPFLVKNLTMPYEDGAIFVQKVYEQGGWEAVTKLFQDPPSSTQQVLHPKKYFDRVEPAEICMPSIAKAAKGKLIEESTLGELNVRIFLEAHGVKEKAAKRVAAGWHGDRYQAVDANGATVLAWLTIWEDEEKAKAFVEAAKPGLSARRGDNAVFEVRGAHVVVVDSDDAELRELASKKAWASALQDARLKALPTFHERPPVTDFTKPESAGFGRTAVIAMGERVKDEDLGFSFRVPTTWKKTDDAIKELKDFSRGCWSTGAEGEMRVLDLPMPFDRENLTQQFEALVRKGTREFKKHKEGARTVGGHEALEVTFEGIVPDGTNKKRDAWAVAVERDSMTVIFLLTTPHGKLGDATPAFEATLASLQFAAVKLADESDVTVGISVDDDGPAWQVKLSTVSTGSSMRSSDRAAEVRLQAGAIRIALSRAPGKDIESERASTEGARAKHLDGYKALGGSIVDHEQLGRVYVSDFEYRSQGAAKRARELVALKDGVRVVLTGSAAVDAFEKARPAIDRAIATLRVEAPAKKQPEKKEPRSDEPF